MVVVEEDGMEVDKEVDEEEAKELICEVEIKFALCGASKV